MSDVAHEFARTGDIEAQAMSLARQLDCAVACLRLADQIAREGVLSLPVRRQFKWAQPVDREGLLAAARQDLCGEFAVH